MAHPSLHFGQSHANIAPVTRPKAIPSIKFIRITRGDFWNQMSLGNDEKQYAK